VITADTTQIQVNPEDVLMLCSDGLHGPLPAAEIAYVVSQRADCKPPLKDWSRLRMSATAVIMSAFN